MDSFEPRRISDDCCCYCSSSAPSFTPRSFSPFLFQSWNEKQLRPLAWITRARERTSFSHSAFLRYIYLSQHTWFVVHRWFHQYNNETLFHPSVLAVIEASSVDNLLDQFEDAAAADLLLNNTPTQDDPKRTAQIMDAVNNHFSSSSRSFPAGRVPKIGKRRKRKIWEGCDWSSLHKCTPHP